MQVLVLNGIYWVKKKVNVYSLMKNGYSKMYLMIF